MDKFPPSSCGKVEENKWKKQPRNLSKKSTSSFYQKIKNPRAPVTVMEIWVERRKPARLVLRRKQAIRANKKTKKHVARWQNTCHPSLQRVDCYVITNWILLLRGTETDPYLSLLGLSLYLYLPHSSPFFFSKRNYPFQIHITIEN